jgi:hypothetical protein
MQFRVHTTVEWGLTNLLAVILLTPTTRHACMLASTSVVSMVKSCLVRYAFDYHCFFAGLINIYSIRAHVLD